MPFRRAHWALLLLAPVIALAFWPQYFGALGSASFAFHAHGITASVWLAFVGLQSLSASARDRRVHRLSGRAVFVFVPLFAAAAVLVMHSMAIKFATQSHPFYAALGARLALHDLVSTIALVSFVSAALVFRRKVAVHAGCMLATVLLVLPPVIARLPIPRFFHSGELIVIALALLILWREPRARTPFLALIGVQILVIILFETLGVSPGWDGVVTAFSKLPVAPFSLGAGLLALGALLLAWSRAPSRTTTARPAPVG